MRHQRIRRALERRPFLPFEARMLRGERHRIPHPAVAWGTPGGTYLLIGMHDGSASMLDTEFVAELTFAGRATDH